MKQLVLSYKTTWCKIKEGYVFDSAEANYELVVVNQSRNEYNESMWN